MAPHRSLNELDPVVVPVVEDTPPVLNADDRRELVFDTVALFKAHHEQLNAQAAGSMMPQGRMREQLDPRCPGKGCASSWIHSASKENAQAAGSTMPQGRMHKHLDSRCLERKCATDFRAHSAKRARE